MTGSPFAEEEERLRHERRAAARVAERRKIQRLQQRMVSGAVAVRRHPDLFAFVQIDGGDAAVRRLEERQALGPGGPGARAGHVVEVRRLGSGLTMSAVNGVVMDWTYSMPVSGSNAPLCQSAPPTEPGSWIVPRWPSGPSPRTDGGVKSGPTR